jgi:uncharacterized protein YlxW (UPF0749 family)
MPTLLDLLKENEDFQKNVKALEFSIKNVETTLATTPGIPDKDRAALNNALRCAKLLHKTLTEEKKDAGKDSKEITS